jgi:hypothetical protein
MNCVNFELPSKLCPFDAFDYLLDEFLTHELGKTLSTSSSSENSTPQLGHILDV